ncbi:MAG: exo-alpha-sialidase [Bacteroidales bacterium]|nr:exo-alpha-sialidase [Bacteroidales bacterium]
MKRACYIASVLFILASCSEAAPLETAPGDAVLTIIPQTEVSRTTLSPEFAMLWEDATDRIGVCIPSRSSGNVQAEPQRTTTGGVVFSASVPEPRSGNKLYAYYPFSESVKGTSSRFSLTVPELQTQAAAGQYNGCNNPMVAEPYVFGEDLSTDGLQLMFRPAGCILAFGIYDSSGAYASEQIESVKFTASKGTVAGTFIADAENFSADAFSFTAAKGSVQVTLDKAAAVGQSENGYVFLTVIPGTYTGSLTVSTANYDFVFPDRTFTCNRATLKQFRVDLAGAGSMSYKGSVILTPFSELNAGKQTVNSHAGECGDASLMKNMRSYVELGPSFGMDAPNYPRVRSMADGSFLLTWQQSDIDGDANGMDVYYALSPDGINWENRGYLFQRVRGYSTPNGNNTKVYTNGNSIVLANGYVCAVASFRPYSFYGKPESQLYSGIELKRSADNGKTWTTTAKVIHRGPNWEAHLVQKSSGRLECYFSESHPLISSSNSGTAMVYSDNNGSTWYPALGSNPWSSYSPIHAIRHNWPADSEYPERYTDQMPVLIQLNGSQQLTGVFETVKSYNASSNSVSFKISQSWSPEDGNWPDLADGPDGWRGTGGQVYSTDSEFYNPTIANSGTAPYIIQFPSGETVVSYSSGRQYAMIGDETARNYSAAFRLFDEGACSWGGLDLCGSHEMMATVRIGRGGDTSTSNPPVIALVRYALNHSISATSRMVKADGVNTEWETSDEAVFVGSKSQAQATLRCSSDQDNVYFLVEVMDESLSSSDYVYLDLSAPGTVLGSDAFRLKLGKDGLDSVSRWNGSSWAVDGSLGITASSAVADGQGWLAEVCVPRASVPAVGELALNLTLYESSVSTTDVLRDSILSNWIKVKNL